MGIVKGHGGFMQVYSSPGQGSTFSAYLPAQPSGTQLAELRSPVADFRGHGETILFVDDEVAVRDTAREVLRRLNFRALLATDGADGVMQVAEHRAELRAIITDLHMPHMDGMDFVRAVRRMLPDIPVVVASGRLGANESEELQSFGVTAHLDKPFTETQLANVLRQILGLR